MKNQFPHKDLKALYGYITGTIFENRYASVERKLRLEARIVFESLEYAGESWDCSFTLGEMEFPGGPWKNIENINIDCFDPSQCYHGTFYLTSHDLAHVKHLKISHQTLTLFRTALEAEVDFQGYTGKDKNPHMPIKIDIVVPFLGVTLSRDGFFPKPNTVADAEVLASPFMDLDEFYPTFEKDGVFNFVPKYD